MNNDQRDAWLLRRSIAIESEFVPFSKSRNKDSKDGKGRTRLSRPIGHALRSGSRCATALEMHSSVPSARSIRTIENRRRPMTPQRTIAVSFARSTDSYHYFVPEGDSPCVGDIVITAASAETGHVHPAAVTEVHGGFVSPKASRMYVLLIPQADLAGGVARQAAHKARIDASKAAHAVLQKMVRESMAEKVFADLAARDPEAQRMLAIMRGETTLSPGELSVLQAAAAPEAKKKNSVPLRKLRAGGAVIDGAYRHCYLDAEDSE